MQKREWRRDGKTAGGAPLLLVKPKYRETENVKIPEEKRGAIHTTNLGNLLGFLRALPLSVLFLVVPHPKMNAFPAAMTAASFSSPDASP